MKKIAKSGKYTDVTDSGAFSTEDGMNVFTLSGRKAGKAGYYKIRAGRTQNDTTVYSSYSAVISVKA